MQKGTKKLVSNINHRGIKGSIILELFEDFNDNNYTHTVKAYVGKDIVEERVTGQSALNGNIKELREVIHSHIDKIHDLMREKIVNDLIIDGFEVIDEIQIIEPIENENENVEVDPEKVIDVDPDFIKENEEAPSEKEKEESLDEW